MTSPKKDRPDVVARPPLIYLGALAVGTGIDLLWPVALLPEPWPLPAGATLIGLGVIILILGVRGFSRAGTNVPTSLPATALVTGGVHGLSRNPLYVGLSLIYSGIAVMADSAWTLGLLPLVLVFMRYGVIAREEAYLEAKFGGDYRRYKAGVRRWL